MQEIKKEHGDCDAGAVDLPAGEDERFRLMADNILDGLAIIEGDRVVYVNDRLCEITGYSRAELLGLDSFDIIAPEMKQHLERDFGNHPVRKMFEEREYAILRKDGRRRIIYNRHSHLLSGSGDRILRHYEIITDITERKDAEEQLRQMNQELERRVAGRTAELVGANAQLRREIEQKVQTELELEAKSKSLEELNAALRVMLKKGDEDKRELEEDLLFNVKELVMPYLEKLSASQLDHNQRHVLDIVRTNLSEITSPFARKLSLSALGFTPREIQVASLIKDGRTTKEIAESLQASIRTIDTHRDNIRKKLDLRRRKANLRTHLLALL